MPICIRKSVRIMNQNEEVMFMLDICAILDCILDPSFPELDITIPNSAIKLCPAMMSVIAHRSPELAKLDVEFSTIICYDDGSDTETVLKIVVKPEASASQSRCTYF